MSILYLLRKYVDPIQFQQQEEEKRRKLETRQAEEAGDDGEGEGKGAAAGRGARYCCRVCGYDGREPDFCPHCLAGTMVPAKEQGAGER